MSASNNILTAVAMGDRNGQRVPKELKTIVQVKEAGGQAFKEVARVATVSRNGAGFNLTRPCTVGCLVSLVMPLEPELRAYDINEEVYPVMGIVQYCNAATVEGERVYHVGVGFVGKKVPESYKADPMQSYRIIGLSKEGLWEITEAGAQFKNRKKPRYWFALQVMITLVRRSDQEVTKETTFTKNVAAGGVSVSCSLDAEVGDKVKFACREFDFYSIAIVRNRKTPKNEMPTLHLEFIDNEFPIEEAVAARMAVAAAV